MMPPRAQLRTRAPFCMQGELRGADQVARLVGQRRVDGEEIAARQEAGRGPATLSMPSWAARSGARNGSKPITFMSRPAARRATSRPMRPRPTTPSVLPASCVPTNLLRSHLPWLHAGVGGGDVAGQGHQQGDGVLGGADGVAAGRVHDDDALARGGGHVDVVDADAGPDDGAQLAGVFEQARR